MIDADREYVANRGHGSFTEGIDQIISRYREMIKTFSPKRKFTANELNAIASANKSFMWQYSIITLPASMAANIEDYPDCEPTEACQWYGVDFRSLAATVMGLHPVECMAIMDAVDVFFQTGKQMAEIIPAK